MIDLFDVVLNKPTQNFVSCTPAITFTTEAAYVADKQERSITLVVPLNSQTARHMYEIETFFDNGVRSLWGLWKGEYCPMTMRSVLRVNSYNDIEITFLVHYLNGTYRVLETTDEEYKLLNFDQIEVGQQVIVEGVVSGACILSDKEFQIRCHASSFQFIKSQGESPCR